MAYGHHTERWRIGELHSGALPASGERKLAGERIANAEQADGADGIHVGTMVSADEQSGLTLREQVDRVPVSPGCYLWKDAAGKVLYVGKAKNLRARMRQYVQLTDEREKIPFLMDEAASFDYVVVGSEHEALVLELNLIQQYRPPYNVDYTDDKSYPFIAVTHGDTYPAIKYTRERHKPSTRYFGPYTDAHAARDAIEVVRRVIPICSANCAEWRRSKRVLEKADGGDEVAALALAAQGRPCFDYNVGKGPGACCGEVTPEEYAANVRAVERFLQGSRKEVVGQLTEEMHEAAAELDFERAGRMKRRLDVIAGLDVRQQVVLQREVDLDLFGIFREETVAGACVFLVREGRVVRTCEFILDKGLDVPQDELVSGLLKRYYRETEDIPAGVEVPCELEDAEALAGWLGARRGHKVTLHVPRRGDRKALMDKAELNARHALMRYKVRTGYDDKRTNDALLQLESALALDAPPMRIECFDISTIHGRFTVASMVVFTAGHADKSQYRRFKIRTPLEEANDFVSMSEVMARRYGPERMADERFGSKPDLLILDGGKPQLTAAIEQLGALGVDIPLCGLAKADEELFVPWDDTPVVLPTGSASLYLVKQVRDEAHRFAITFHRELRDKAMTMSVLDDVPGVGAKRKKAIMRHFGSMKRLRAATPEQIAEVKGVPEDVAREVWATLRAWEAEAASARERKEAELADA